MRISAARITAFTGLIMVAIALWGCGGGSSAKVQQPQPQTGIATIRSINPTSAAVGSADLMLSVTGSNFLGERHNLSQAAWSANGSITFLATTYVSSTQLTVVVPAALLSNPITAQVLVETGDPMGDIALAKSNSLSFSVNKTSPGSASITSLSPTSAAPGSPDLTLTILGSNFDGAGVIQSRAVWTSNGGITPLSTRFVSSTQLTAVVPAALLSIPVTAQVSVQSWDHIENVVDAVSNSESFGVTSADSAVAISPTADTLGPNSVRQFVATLSGPDTAVTWRLEEGEAGGTVTSAGVYTAPSTTGIFHVIASSTAQPADNAKATVTVVNSGFTPTGSMHAPRSGHRATLLGDGRVLVVSSDDGSAELYDPVTGAFALTGSMTTPRYGATFTLLANGKVLVTGGFGPGSSGPLPRLLAAELYDPQSGSFTLTGSMGVGRVLHTATLLKDGKVLIAGGTDESGGGGAATASAELYDPAAGTFTPAGTMLTDRAQHTATLLKSGEVLIAGGWNGHAADSIDDPPWDPLFAELFDPTSGTFKSTGSMSTTRHGHTATRLADGRVLMLGGIPSLQNIHSQPPAPEYAEIYDPATRTFSGLDNLTMSRQGYTVTLLQSGEVLLAGGKILELVIPTAELLNLTTGALSATGGLGTERVGHTATLLNDGRVLVTGGTDANGNALSTAELYQ
jgi:Galactose oxidase, central domain